ncbi:hypothetical protein GGF46_002736 [Coemansia sp. RSA 552]|nr:hypothetical protein GGF46_002736 [Coemansia sp. RSA 552]
MDSPGAPGRPNALDHMSLRQRRVLAASAHAAERAAEQQQQQPPPSPMYHESNDPTLTFFYHPRTLTVLMILLAAFLYVALFVDPSNDMLNTKWGLVALCSVFVVVSIILFRDGPFVRPHPAFWRGALALNVLYEMFLVFLLFQSKQTGRQIMQFFDPALGIILPERSYGDHCELTWANVRNGMDAFVLAHSLGWFGKTLIIRNSAMCWLLSITFELLEYSLAHQLPNFHECWWDHWILDVLLCNWLGIYVGMRCCEHFKMKKYTWSAIPSIRGRISRAGAQFTPRSWTVYQWSPTHGFKRFAGFVLFIVLIMLAEVNVFYLKFLLWIPPEHPLVIARLSLLFLFSLPSAREYYEYYSNPRCKRMGAHCWLLITTLLTELLIVVKFGRGEFAEPFPRPVIAFWSLVAVALVAFSAWRFLIAPRLRSHDVVVAVYTDAAALHDRWAAAAAPFRQVDKEFGKAVVLIPAPEAGGGRLVLSPVGSLDDDTDDVRKVFDAVRSGVARAIEAGARRPAIHVGPLPPAACDMPDADYTRWLDVALLAALDASYVTLVVREHLQATQCSAAVVERLLSIDLVAEGCADAAELSRATSRVQAIEAGRRLALDMGYGDPERMTPHNCAQTIRKAVAAVPGVRFEQITDLDVIKKEYPLLYSSARASLPVQQHLHLVGKGVTYDTGGISLKIGGSMRGMSRDKLGACGVAGFLLATGLIQEPTVDVSCILAFERNSIGPNSLLPDEVIVSRAGVRVLINDTDAEGRLVMTDPVAECRERILAARAAGNATPAAIYTVATLTGHVIRAYGWYGATVANGPARRGRYDQRLAAAGLAYGDPFENSIMRREDHQFVRARTDREDVYQSNSQPSTLTDRGHQYPAAFLIKASGLDRHSLGAAGAGEPIPFIHVDIAGSAEDGCEPGLGLGAITGSPVATFAGAFWSV